MTPIIYGNLTRAEIDFIVVKDCGSHLLDVPDFSFDSACWPHDVYYWTGSLPYAIGVASKNRKKIDLMFYQDMQNIVNDMPWYQRIYMRFIPRIYYYGVRIGGKNSFNWKKRRYYEDLVYAMTLADHSDNLPENWDN